MAEDSKTYVFGNDSVPAWLAYGNNNNNGWFGGNGLAGEVGKRMFKKAKKLLCDTCRKYVSN